MRSNQITFYVDGYEVSASFAQTPNREIYDLVKHILISSFVNKRQESCSVSNLVLSSDLAYNIEDDSNTSVY